MSGVATDSETILAPLSAKSLLQDVVAVAGSLIAVGDRGHVLISNDQGQSWEQVAAVPTRSMLIAATVIGNRVWAVGHDSVIISSDDAGESWQLVHEEDGGDPLLDIVMDADGSGIAVGAYGLYMHTSDWGQNWDLEHLSDLLIAAGDEPAGVDEVQLDAMGLIDQKAMAEFEDEDIAYHLNGLSRIDKDNLLIAAEAGRYYSSNDNGVSWRRHRLDYEGSLFGVTRMLSSKCLFMYGLRGHLFRNCPDNPDAWQQIQTGSDAGLFAASEGRSGELWVVGANGAIFNIGSNGQINDYTVDLGDDFTAVLPMHDHVLLLGESGSQRKDYAALH